MSTSKKSSFLYNLFLLLCFLIPINFLGFFLHYSIYNSSWPGLMKNICTQNWWIYLKISDICSINGEVFYYEKDIEKYQYGLPYNTY